MTSRYIALASLVALLTLGIVTSPSLASPVDGARTSSKPAGGGSTSTPAELTASPNPVPAWSQYTLRGCGFVTGKQVSIVINGGTFFSAAVDGAGCLVPVSWYVDGPGTYRIDGYQRLRGRKQILMATTMLSAV